MSKGGRINILILSDISQALQKGKAKEVVSLVREAIDSGIPAKDILDNVLLKGMEELGERFKKNEAFVPEVLIAARALNKGTEALKEKLIEEDVETMGLVLMCTVKGDLHDIGKNLVKMMFEGAKFEVIDLGVDVHEDVIVAAVKEYNPAILCLSALLTTTLNEQKVVIEALKKAGVRDKVKVMVGGAPVTQDYCDRIGADLFAPDAGTAAKVARGVVVE